MKAKAQIIEAIVDSLEIPSSSYEKAQDRYNDLGKWFCDGKLKENKPRIYAQGSFRLGTVIRPLHEGESFDLDVGCRLELGISKSTHSQKQLKDLIGVELEAYKKARRIEKEIEEKHRCWCLEYSDQLSFSEDIVPSIPEETVGRALIAAAMVRNGVNHDFATSVANHAGSITDNRRPNYSFVDSDWLISNSEGYALWFESRMEIETGFQERLRNMALQAKVEKLPVWRWKTPLQKAIQLLKRHRDSMFISNPECKPISIIITTLAAYAYQGEQDLASALERILKDMDSYISPTIPRVPNPVNQDEDFADKWYRTDCREYMLEDNFKQWLTQARSDFKNLEALYSEERVQKFAQEKFKVRIPQSEMGIILPNLKPPQELGRPNIITCSPIRPWCENLESF
jgi:hypothetical protein